MKLIPKGWQKYQPLGECVPGTRFIPFKVPLRLKACTVTLPNEEDWFTPTILLQKRPGLKTIVDLTDTNKYYDPQEFRELGVTHVKINVAGGGRLPQPLKMRQFFEAVDDCLEKYRNDPDALIGVHCTHGLNRTGYFICNYMVNRLNMSTQDAIAQFESARGHTMERQVLLRGIGVINVQAQNVQKESTPICRNYQQYRSPLEDTYEESKTSRDFNSRCSFKARGFQSNCSTNSTRDSFKNQPGRIQPYNRQTSYANGTRNRNRGRFGNRESGSSSSSGNWRERP